jgi:hypothetical protein
MAEETEFNVQRDWDFDVNLSGVQAPTGKGGNQLPTGYYKAKLADLYVNPDKNPDRVIIKAQVCEGPYNGVIRTDGLNKPKGAEDKVRHYWRGLAESIGYGARELDAGQIRLGPGTFKDRTGHMFFTAREDAEDGYEDITWLAPMEWSQQKQNFEMTGGVQKEEAAPAAATGSALGAAPRDISQSTPLGALPTPAGGNSGPSAGSTAKVSELMNTLGVKPS